jgi:hypothetical protein
VNNPKPWKDITTPRGWIAAKKQLREIFKLIDESPARIFQNAGLSRDLYYKSLGPRSDDFPMRLTTVKKLGDALNVDYAYLGPFPFFGHVLLEAQNGPNFRTVVRDGMEGILSVELLAYKVGIPTSELVDILDESGERVSIPITVFQNLAHSMDMSISDTPDNTIRLLDSNREIAYYAGYIDKLIINKTNSDEVDEQPEIKDKGLKELLTHNYRFQYSITKKEADELTGIHSRRNSKATLSQWVTILYAIRSLDD